MYKFGKTKIFKQLVFLNQLQEQPEQQQPPKQLEMPVYATRKATTKLKPRPKNVKKSFSAIKHLIKRIGTKLRSENNDKHQKLTKISNQNDFLMKVVKPACIRSTLQYRNVNGRESAKLYSKL